MSAPPPTPTPPTPPTPVSLHMGTAKILADVLMAQYISSNLELEELVGVQSRCEARTSCALQLSKKISDGAAIACYNADAVASDCRKIFPEFAGMFNGDLSQVQRAVKEGQPDPNMTALGEARELLRVENEALEKEIRDVKESRVKLFDQYTRLINATAMCHPYVQMFDTPLEAAAAAIAHLEKEGYAGVGGAGESKGAEPEEPTSSTSSSAILGDLPVIHEGEDTTSGAPAST